MHPCAAAPMRRCAAAPMRRCAAAPMRRSADALSWQFRTCGVLARADRLSVRSCVCELIRINWLLSDRRKVPRR